MVNFRFFLLCFILVCFTTLSIAQQKITWQVLDQQISKIKSLSYKNTADSTIKLFYQLPNNIKSTKKYPAIIFIHGGAWTGGNADTFFSYASYFATRGMVGISIDYRLMKSQNDDINNCISDCKSAFRYIKKNADELNIDTNKIVVCGESAGGHLAASLTLLKGFNNEKDDLKIATNPASLILLNPVLNLNTNVFLKYLDASLLKVNSQLLDYNELSKKYSKSAIAISPLFQLNEILQPTLIINGADDKITPVEYARQFEIKAKSFGSRCELMILPNVGHAFSVPHYKSSEEIAVNTILAMDKFLISLKYIKGKSSLINGNDRNWILKK